MQIENICIKKPPIDNPIMLIDDFSLNGDLYWLNITPDYGVPLCYLIKQVIYLTNYTFHSITSLLVQ